MPRRRNMSFFGGFGAGAPWSWMGLILALLSGGGGILYYQLVLVDAEGFKAFGGFGILLLWIITVPIAFLLALIGLLRGEKPIALPLSVMILCALPVLYFFWLAARN